VATATGCLRLLDHDILNNTVPVVPRRFPGHSVSLPRPSRLRRPETQTAVMNRSSIRRHLVLGLALAISLAGGSVHAQSDFNFGDGPNKSPGIDEPSEAQTTAGLVAVYRSLVEPDARVTRIDAKPAFWMEDSSPHPRIPPGPWESVWT